MVDQGTVPLDLPTLESPTELHPKVPKKVKNEPKEPKSDLTQCYVCGEQNSDKTQILEHIKSKHFPIVKSSMYGEPRQYQCHTCHIMFSSNGALGLHLCGEIPPRWSGNTLTSKTCQECGQKFNKRFDLLCHITKKHTKTKNFSCDHCDYKASVPFLLTKHVRRKHSEHREKSHLCEDCGAMFTEKTFLLAHISQVHKDVKNPFCVYCGLTHRSQMSLVKHVKMVHDKDSNIVKSDDCEKPFKCGSCDTCEKTIEELHTHLKVCHKDLRENVGQQRPKIRFVCPHCDKVVSNR